jgi:hypothetical protein
MMAAGAGVEVYAPALRAPNKRDVFVAFLRVYAERILVPRCIQFTAPVERIELFAKPEKAFVAVQSKGQPPGAAAAQGEGQAIAPSDVTVGGIAKKGLATMRDPQAERAYGKGKVDAAGLDGEPPFSYLYG